MESLKKETRARQFILFAAVLLGVMALLRVILAGYGAAWTGFGEYVLPESEYVRGKTLWDWMELLIIPLFLAGGAFVLQRSERAAERNSAEDQEKLEREIATDRQQEAALQAYLDRMAELLLDEKLGPDKSEKALYVMRVRTLTVLRELNALRNGIVLRFLRDIGFVGTKESSLFMAANLEGADLRGVNLSETNLERARLEGANLEQAFLISVNLKAAILRNANLERVHLRGANLDRAVLTNAILRSAALYQADLQNANLSGAYLEGAELQSANLQNANLESAHLQDVNLRDARLQGAFLRRVNLKGAKVSAEQLATVKSLDGATMPDGRKRNGPLPDANLGEAP
jgi:uncharacterized protein YjbI with pentapeptide repeats